MTTKVNQNGFQTMIPPPLLTAVSDDPFEFTAAATDPIPDDNMEVENNFTDIMNAPEVSEQLEINKEKHYDYAQKLVNCCVQTFTKIKVVGSRKKKCGTILRCKN